MKTITERKEKAYIKAKPLIEKYHNMDLDEKLKFIKENKTQYKKEQSIIMRYYNLEARDNGYAQGMKQFIKENKQ